MEKGMSSVHEERISIEDRDCITHEQIMIKER